MHALDQRVRDHDELARRRRHDPGAVVSDSDAHVGPLGAEPREVFADELKLGLHFSGAHAPLLNGTAAAPYLHSTLVWAQVTGGRVQHRVDELVAVGGGAAV